MNRTDLLNEAIELTTQKRDADYGSPGANFLRTARLWSAYLGYEIKHHDVAALMILAKIARIRHRADKADSWVDVAGYAACGAEVACINTSKQQPEAMQQTHTSNAE